MPCRALQRGLSVEVDCRTMSRLGFQNSCLEAWYVLIKPTCFVIDRRRTRHCGSRGEKRGTSLPRSQSASRLGDLKKPVILSALPDELGQTVVGSQFRSALQSAGTGLSLAQKHVRRGNVQVIGNQNVLRFALAHVALPRPTCEPGGPQNRPWTAVCARFREVSRSQVFHRLQSASRSATRLIPTQFRRDLQSAG